MRVRQSSTKQQELDAEWLRECTDYINKNNDEKKFELVNKIFIETYYENLREGMNPKFALQKAKWVAFCFLMLKQK
jgi:hypothetical protein